MVAATVTAVEATALGDDPGAVAVAAPVEVAAVAGGGESRTLTLIVQAFNQIVMCVFLLTSSNQNPLSFVYVFILDLQDPFEQE